MLHDDSLQKCVDEIVLRFKCDTLIFIDCVLTDDPKDPQFSPKTALRQAELIATYEDIIQRKTTKTSVFDWIKSQGYSKDDIDTFNKKLYEEQLLKFD